MYEYQGWWFPDAESHFPKMLKKSVDKGGPAEYQYQVRNKSLTYVTQFRTGLDIGANVGLWSRSLVTKFERVFAFEPVPMFRECLQKNVAGKNFGTFDKLFLQELPWWQKLIRTRQRVLDPAILMVDWKNDKSLPNLTTCKERADIQGIVTHNALEDAWDVIEVLRKFY
jgi:hypothetical protein